MNIWSNTKTLDEFIDTIDNKEDADIILLGSKSVDLDEFPNARGIFRVGVGEDNVPFEEARKRNIRVEFPSEYTTSFIYEETANFTCYMIMKMLYSSVGCVDTWTKESRKAFSRYNLLVIGNGTIGSMVTHKMCNFMNVEVFDILTHKNKDLKQFMLDADCVSLHIPLTDDNENFIDKEKLSWMKGGSSLINTSRGAIVSEDALYNAIKNDGIRASFDVFWKEPYNGKLKEFLDDGFYMTPHIASTNKEFLSNSAKDLMAFTHSLEEVEI
ncbi:MAG: hydroxyacid dehydrogenase [Proteobacteria bacterium]|nr:hydroxyacid dehydrogenase [Pseudomonadota bacterium]